MNDLHVKRSFNTISQEFLSNDFDLRSIAHLLAKIREHREHLTSEQYRNLLEIPIDVLRNDVVLLDEKDYQTHGGEYFYGNIGGRAEDHEFLQYFVGRIKAEELTLNDMVAYTKCIQDNPSLQSNDYLLRNPEVTLRNYVKLYSPGNFMESGRVFANLIDRVIGI